MILNIVYKIFNAKHLSYKTLSNNLSFEGIGLHSGKKTNLLVKPAKEDVGIVFKRVDLDQNNLVVANYKNVTFCKIVHYSRK